MAIAKLIRLHADRDDPAYAGPILEGAIFHLQKNNVSL